MDPRLRLEVPVTVRSVDRQGRALDPGFVSGQEVQRFNLESLPFSPPHVHAQQHLRPILGFRAAGPGVDGEDGVVGIPLPRQQHLDSKLAEG